MGLAHHEALQHNLGNDIDPFAVHLASINLATRRIRRGINHPLVRQGDAFDLSPGNTNMLHIFASDQTDAEDYSLSKVDVVIANPPYGRQAENELAWLAHLQGHGLPQVPKTSGINLAAWFVLLGAVLTKPAGRMAFVLPSSVLQNDNLASWRGWLRARYDLTVWHTEADVWFSDARVAACVMLLEPRTSDEGSFGYLKFVDVLAPVDGELHWIDGVACPSDKVIVRDLSALDGGADFLIPGTVPEVLQKFARLNNVAVLQNIDGVEVAAGTKLGHKVFKLEDVDPSSSRVLRDVKGLGTTVQLNRKFLTPLLAGAKDIDTGEPRLGRFWLLTAPKTRPGATTALGSYIRLAESQRIHQEASVKARRPWWHLSVSPVHVAASMNEQFRHQIAWFDNPTVVTNNFNTVIAPKKRAELIAASLASAFGGVASQYISGEVGCEGVRRVLLGHFAQWLSLIPHTEIPPKLQTEVRHAYASYRQLKFFEFDTMPQDEARALLRLTYAVSAAAHGADTPASRLLAEEAMECVKGTVTRRRTRETAALSGRTRPTKASGTNLPRRVKNWCQGSELVSELLPLLVSGQKIVRLREAEEIDAPQLFQVSDFDAFPEEEKELSSLLGAGFETAFPVGDNQFQDLQRLIELTQRIFDGAAQDLLPSAPSSDNPGYETWCGLRDSMWSVLRKTLQTEVRHTLN
ncbi:Eco57I restriction-modification methylase domain-containing protein [Arthrobacter sp. D2-10]